MLTEFNRIYSLEIDLKNLEVVYNSKALYANSDLNTSTMLIKLSLDEKPLDVTDKIVTAYIRTDKDHNVIMQRCEILEADEGIVGLDFKSSALKTGTNTFFLEIKSDNEEIINSPLITYKVVELFDVLSGVEGENEDTVVRQIIKEIDIVKTSVEDLQAEIDILKKSVEDLQNIKIAGKEIQMRKSEEHIQWKYVEEDDWNNLISIAELKGEQGTQGIQGINGQDGTDGKDGKDGTTPNLTVGTVTTLEPTSNVTVTIGGTKENPTLNFGIPKGEKGNDGKQGLQGQQGKDGRDGENGKSLEFDWDDTRLGIRVQGSSDFEYVNLKGSVGEQGKQGEKGDNGIYVGSKDNAPSTACIIIDDSDEGLYMDESVVTPIKDSKLNLTLNKRQKTTMLNNITIVLPVVDRFAEIHLIFSTTEELTLILPKIKWQSDINIEANKTYEFIFTYDDEWLGGCVTYE